MGGDSDSSKLNITEFARLVGVTPSAVHNAISTARLVKSLTVGTNGKHLIDPVLGKAEFEANKKRGAGRAAKLRAQKEAASGGDSQIESERRKKFYDAEIARLKFEEQAGNLLDAEKVRRHAFNAARSVRNALLSIPDRLAAELAGETDQFAVHRRLEEEIRIALENLSSEIKDEDEEDDEAVSEEESGE